MKHDVPLSCITPRAAPSRRWHVTVFTLALLIQGASLWARPSAETLEALTAADRLRAARNAREFAALSERIRTNTTARVAELDAESSAARDELARLQKELLAASTKDDPAAIHLIRARLSACQAAIDAANDERTLRLKESEEADREVESWKKRSGVLELALRMDMQAMLAGPAEITDREKRVDAAARDIDNQVGQIRKYASRRVSAAVELANLRYREAVLKESSSPSTPAEVRDVHQAEARSLARLIAQQEQWIRLNKQLEDRARRNLTFARADYLVSQRYAEALARKAGFQQAAAAQAAADRSEAQLAAIRTALTPIQQRIAKALAEASRQAETNLKTVGDAQATGEQDQARRAYAAALKTKERLEAESECWKEFVALQKASTAYAQEKADRSRAVAGDRGIVELTQDERLLRESLDTSEQYVRSFQRMIQKTDDQIESARRELGLDPQAVTNLAQTLADLFRDFDATQPPTPDTLAGRFEALIGNLPETRMLVARTAQREMLRVRASISERWLENSKASIRSLQALASARLWRQHDPRLNSTTCRELGSLVEAIVSDAGFAVDSLRLRMSGVAGTPTARTLCQAASAVALVWVLAWLAARRIPGVRPALWYSGRLVAFVLPSAFAGCLTMAIGRGNLAFAWAGSFLLTFAAWRALRNLMLVFTTDHRPPAGTTAGGAVFMAANTITFWMAALYPFHLLAGRNENAADIRAVLQQLWLLGVFLALFRLVLHPAFMGRLLSRRSKHRGLRFLGTGVAAACITAAVLAALPYLAGLDNLGLTVLHTVEASFAVLTAAMIGTAATSWILRRKAAAAGRGTGWIRPLQAIVVLAAAGAAAGAWWRLLNQVVLAPNAPAPVQELVGAVAHGARDALQVWHREIAAGMTVSSLTRGTLVFILSFWVSRVIRRAFQERVLSRTPMDETTRLTFATILGYLVILLGFLVGLNVAGSSLQNLALLAGAITVGLGFGLQNVINNFVSSLLIHFGRTIRVGDYIEAAGTRGTVREIGLRNTMIVTDDGVTVLVPNGSFITANIVNWTNPSRRTRLHVPVTVARQADLGTVTELLTGIAGRHPLILKNPPPVVEVRSATATQVTAELLVWTEKPERLTTIVGELNLAIDRTLRERGFAV